jgi:hypothetical protein
MFSVSWWTILGAVGALLVVVLYGYSISSQIKVASPAGGCSSCPGKTAETPEA